MFDKLRRSLDQRKLLTRLELDLIAIDKGPRDISQKCKLAIPSEIAKLENDLMADNPSNLEIAHGLRLVMANLTALNEFQCQQYGSTHPIALVTDIVLCYFTESLAILMNGEKGQNMVARRITSWTARA